VATKDSSIALACFVVISISSFSRQNDLLRLLGPTYSLLLCKYVTVGAKICFFGYFTPTIFTPKFSSAYS
jgi:hypothetical protein